MAARKTDTTPARPAPTATNHRRQPPSTTATSAADKGRITVDLNPDLYRRFKTSCAWHDRAMNQVVRELVTAWLVDHPIG